MGMEGSAGVWSRSVSHILVPVLLRSPLPATPLPQARLAQLVMAVPLCACAALAPPY